jgi:hypothetical protein
MIRMAPWRLHLLALTTIFVFSTVSLHADGGTVRLSERRGSYEITVFTSPTPVRAGTVDISVFLRDAATQAPISNSAIEVSAVSRVHPDKEARDEATREKATNKLFQAAILDLPEPGWWDVTLVIDGLGQPLEFSFELEVEEPLPRIWVVAPWIAWPMVPILLFLIHQRWTRRKR